MDAWSAAAGVEELKEFRVLWFIEAWVLDTEFRGACEALMLFVGNGLHNIRLRARMSRTRESRQTRLT